MEAAIPTVHPPFPSLHADEDEKAKVEIDHVEHDAAPVAPVSAYADLGFLATLRTFRRTALMCVMALFTACSDGYQYSLPGNLVAEKSFIGESLCAAQQSEFATIYLTVDSRSQIRDVELG